MTIPSKYNSIVLIFVKIPFQITCYATLVQASLLNWHQLITQHLLQQRPDISFKFLGSCPISSTHHREPSYTPTKSTYLLCPLSEVHEPQ